MKSLKNKIITAITAVYLLATPAGVESSTRVVDENSLENKTELVYGGDSILRNTLNLNSKSIDGSVAPSTIVVEVGQSKPEKLNNEVKFIVKYKSKFTGFEETIESTIKKPKLAKSIDELGVFETDKYDVGKSTYKDKKYRRGINRTIDATIIDGKDILLMRYSVKHGKIRRPNDEAIKSIVDLYTTKNGKTKNVWYAYVDQFGLDNSKILLTYYDRNVLNVDKWDEEKYIVSKINLDTKAKAEFIREDESETWYKYSTVTDEFVDAQKVEFGVGLYYMYEINNRINVRESLRKQELEKREQKKTKELYDEQKSSIQENSMW